MIFPIPSANTEVHRPWGTSALVILNLAAAFAVGLVDPAWSFLEPRDPALLDALVLHFGETAPHQWITSAFVHGNLLHLAGNMLFLMTFGMLVEDRLGWRRFLWLYVLLAGTEGMATQALFRDAEGAAFGASGVGFGLMAAAALWEPKYRIDFFFAYYLVYGLRRFQITVSSFAFWFIGWAALVTLVLGFRPSSALLHLLGAVLGAGAGTVCLVRGWVDTEERDAFSLWSKERSRWNWPEFHEFPPVPRKHWSDHLRDLVNLLLIFAGSGFLAAALLTFFQPVGDAGGWELVGRYFMAFAFLGTGVLLLHWWRDR